MWGEKCIKFSNLIRNINFGYTQKMFTFYSGDAFLILYRTQFTKLMVRERGDNGLINTQVPKVL